MSIIIKGMDMPKKGVYHAVITFDGDSLGVRIPPSTIIEAEVSELQGAVNAGFEK